MTASETHGAQSGLRRLPVALQLYSVREQLQGDFQGTVRAVGEMGYDGVQFAGYGGLGAEAMRRLLEESHLLPAGTHTGLDVLEGRLDEELDYNLAIGNRWIVCPALPESRRRDLAGWREVAASLNRIGERCAARGLRFGYHNHAFEFPPIPDGGGALRGPHPSRGDQSHSSEASDSGRGVLRGIDILLGETDSQLVFWEPDVYWITKGGADPAAMIREYGGRVPITHLKDMTGDARQTFAEVGEGTLDWPAILAASDGAGVEWHCVEQDRCDRPPLESVRLSVQHLRSWGMGVKNREP